MPVITRALAVRGSPNPRVPERAVFEAEQDWRVTAISLPEADLVCYVQDYLGAMCEILRSSEGHLNINLVLEAGTRLVFENRNPDFRTVSHAFFCAESLLGE